MQRFKSFVLLLAVTALSPLVLAVDDPAQERHERMEKVGDAAGPLGAMLKGELEFDAATAMSNWATMQSAIDGIGELFPEGSYVEGEKRAAQAVWDNRADFNQKMADFSASLEAAIEAHPQDLETYKPIAMDVFGNCKGCHEEYRTPGD